VLGLLGVLLVVGLGTAGVATVLVLGRSVGLTSTSPMIRGASGISAAAADAIPQPGQTGAATCIDPVAGQEWRVTWRAVIGWDPPPTTTATGSATTAGASRSGTAAPTMATAVPLGPYPTAPRAPDGTTTAAVTAPAAVTTAPDGLSAPDPPDAVTSGKPSPDLLPTGFAVRTLVAASPAPGEAVGQPGGWRSEDDALWRVRWTPTSAQASSAGPQESFQRDGSLITLAGMTLSLDNSPRYVTPDGACSVYLVPFLSSFTARTSAAALAGPVAVIGDGLLTQSTTANDGSAGDATTATEVRARLTASGRRSELVGQPGAHWTVPPELSPGLPLADETEFDEIRGLQQTGALVIALGADDAQWVASSPDRRQSPLREASMLMQVAPLIQELRTGGQCIVLVTVAQPQVGRKGSPAARFADAAGRMNAELRHGAAVNPNDRLKLWDWAASADRHRIGDPQPWFDSATSTDGAHLSTAGVEAYANALTHAAALC
jgi:hypothetical protein